MNRLDYYRKKGRLVHLDLMEDEIDHKCFRASHLCECDQCGKIYIDHPYIDNFLDRDGLPFLHLICDGSIVKL